jgi:hypothetical protein
MSSKLTETITRLDKVKLLLQRVPSVEAPMS